MSKQVLIRADASTHTGIGHIMRSMALGQALQDRGYAVAYACREIPGGLQDRLVRENFQFHDLGKLKRQDKEAEAEDARAVADLAQKLGAKWVVADGYAFQTLFQTQIKDKGLFLACIDDLAHCHFVSDLVINQNLNAETVFKYSHAATTRLLLGSQYILLRREFLSVRSDRKIRDHANRVLVTIGGGDESNQTLKIFKALEKVPDLHVQAVLGPAFPHSDTLTAFQSTTSLKHLEILPAQENMAPLIQACDVAVAAAGGTTWELCYLGTPMILGVVANNQLPIASEMEKKGAADSVGWFEKVQIEALAESVTKLLASKSLRAERAAAARKVCDGSGVSRIIAAMESY